MTFLFLFGRIAISLEFFLPEPSVHVRARAVKQTQMTPAYN